MTPQKDQLLQNRHEIEALIEVVWSNLNGDSENGNMPRIDSTTNIGFATDVCLKRLIRDYVEKCYKGKSPYAIMYELATNRNAPIMKAFEETGGIPKEHPNRDKADAARAWLCQNFFDVRTFGAVLNGAKNAGQVRGPVQVTYADSLSPIQQMDMQIAVKSIIDPVSTCKTSADYVEWAKNQPQDKLQTFGRKQVIPYGVYRVRIFVSPFLAEDTGFMESDFKLFLEAFRNMYELNRSASKGYISVRDGWVFKHVGSESDGSGHEQRIKLGCAPAYKLFDAVDNQLSLKDGVETPRKYGDYNIPTVESVRKALDANGVRGIEVSAL